jgi:hypothetical protein
VYFLCLKRGEGVTRRKIDDDANETSFLLSNHRTHSFLLFSSSTDHTPQSTTTTSSSPHALVSHSVSQFHCFTLKTQQKLKLHNDTEELDKERKRKVDDDKTNGV